MTFLPKIPRLKLGRFSFRHSLCWKEAMSLPMDSQPSNINLLKKPGNTTLDTILHFAVTGGRFIVLFTETVALAAFLYRFTLDRKIIDTRDEIKANQTIVEQYQPLETTYRGVQDRIDQASKLSKDAPTLPNLFTQIVSKGSGNVTFYSLLMSNELIKIEADTDSVASLNTFVTALRNDPMIEEVSIDKIENRTSSALISVAITAQVKGSTKEKKVRPVKEPIKLEE